MAYVNPFFLFQPFINPEQTIAEQLPLLRKKILSEISLSAEGYIEAQGQVFTKNDVLQYFENLRNTPNLDFYERIAKDPVLHSFLSGQFPMRAGWFLTNKEYADPEFISFISPMFKESYVEYVLKAFQSDIKVRGTIFNEQHFFTAGDKIEAYSSVGSYLEKKNAEIAEIKRAIRAGKIVSEFKEDIFRLCAENYIRYLNLLPADFDNIRDTYATEMTNLGVEIESKDRPLAKILFANIAYVSCNEELTKLLTANNEALNSAQTIVKKTGGKWEIIKIVAVIIFFVRVLVGVFSHSKSNTGSQSTLDKYLLYQQSGGRTYTQNFNANKMLRDLMECYSAYYLNLKNLKTPAKQKLTDYEISLQLGKLSFDSAVILKYAENYTESYQMQRLNINNNTNYDAYIFYTEENTVKKFWIRAHEVVNGDFPSNATFGFYMGKDFDDSQYITFMGKRLNGVFKTPDQNTFKLLDTEFNEVGNGVTNLTLTETKGVVSLQYRSYE